MRMSPWFQGFWWGAFFGMAGIIIVFSLHGHLQSCLGT